MAEPETAKNHLKVLFVCVGNCCRSQMAEGLASKMAPEWKIFSAGLLPAGYVSNGAIAAMEKIGIDISGQQSKGLDEVNLDAMDVVVSLGGFPTTDFVAQPEGKVTEDWDIPDPMGHTIQFFEIVRDQIEIKIRELKSHLEEKKSEPRP